MKCHICKVFCLLISCIIFSNVLSFAQMPTIQWQKSAGGSGDEAAYTIDQAADGGYIAAGHTNSSNGDVTNYHDSGDCWIVKFSSAGAIQWQKTLGGSGSDHAWSIRHTFDGGYIVAGSSKSTNGDVTGNHGGTDMWVVKLDDTGAIQWQRCLGGSGMDQGNGVVQSPDSNYVVCGFTHSNDGDVSGNHGSDDVWVVKLDDTGGIIWQKTFGGTADDEAYAMQLTNDGGFIVAGSTASHNGDVSGNFDTSQGNYWALKLSSSGSLQWQKCVGSTGWDLALSVQQTSDSGYILNGYAAANDSNVTGNHGNIDYWAVKLSGAGALQWQKCYGGTDFDYAESIYPTSDGGYVMAGAAFSSNGDVINKIHSNADYWVVKTTASGSIQWQECLGGAGEDWAHAVQQTSDGGYIIAGYSKSADGDVTGHHSGSDFWVVKLMDHTSVNFVNGPSGISVYPNPASNLLTITSTDKISQVAIYNLLGQTIQTQIPLAEQASIDVSHIPNGVYIININGAEVRRFVKE